MASDFLFERPIIRLSGFWCLERKPLRRFQQLSILLNAMRWDAHPVVESPNLEFWPTYQMNKQ